MKPISLNSQVAKKLFKYTHVEFSGSREQYLNKAMSKERGGTWFSEVPNYSGTWDGAALVIEKMRKLGWCCEIDIRGKRGGTATFFRQNEEANLHWIHHGGSVPTAICMAALSSLKAKNNG